MSKKKKKKPEGLTPKPVVPHKIPKKSQSFPLKHFLAIGLMVAISLVAYTNTFQVPFQFDDLPNILEYPPIQIKSLSFDQLERLIRNVYQESLRIFGYFTFALNYYLGEFHVFGYHLINLLIHIASGIFLFGFLLFTFTLPSLKKRYGPLAFPIALFSSLLFLAHPIQTQAVTYIVQRLTSMAAMFYLLSMLLYIKARRPQEKYRVFYFAGSALSYLLGLFSKENTAILPLFIALYEFYFFQKLELNIKSKKIFSYVIGVVLLIAILGLLLWGKRYFDFIIVEYKKWDFTLTERILTQFRVVLFYLTLLLYPHPSRLNLDHDFPISKGILDPPTTLISILIVIGLIGYSIWIARRRPVLSFFILWYFGNLVIESSIFPLEMAYEHRLYLPMIGPIVLFVILVIKVWEKLKKVIGKRENGKGNKEEIENIRHQTENKGQETDRNWQLGIGYWRGDWPLWGFFLVITVLLCIGTYNRNTIWKDPVTLWEDTVKKSPNKDRPYFNLGLSYYNISRYKEAIEAFQKAIRIKPNDPETYNNLGMAYKAMNDYPKAIEAYQKAIQIKPNFSLVLRNLEFTYDEIGRPQDAIETLKKAIQLKPTDADLQNHLGMKYKKLGRYQEAIEAYQNAIRLQPGNPEPYNNIGLAYFSMGKLKEALEAFEKAIRLKANDGEFYYNLGVTYSTLGNHPAGVEAYKKAIQIKPDDSKARFNLGLSYLIQKRKDLALEEAKMLMNYDKDQATKLMNLINK